MNSENPTYRSAIKYVTMVSSHVKRLTDTHDLTLITNLAEATQKQLRLMQKTYRHGDDERLPPNAQGFFTECRGVVRLAKEEMERTNIPLELEVSL